MKKSSALDLAQGLAKLFTSEEYIPDRCQHIASLSGLLRQSNLVPVHLLVEEWSNLPVQYVSPQLWKRIGMAASNLFRDLYGNRSFKRAMAYDGGLYTSSGVRCMYPMEFGGDLIPYLDEIMGDELEEVRKRAARKHKVRK